MTGKIKKAFPPTIIMTSLAILAVRVTLSFFPSFEYDENDFRLWSLRLAEGGLSHFYSTNVFTSNPVGFLYFLWVDGLLKINFFPNLQLNSSLYDALLKLPANLADIATGLLIFYVVKLRRGLRWATAGFLLYSLNPAVVFDGAVWGQYDAIPTFFLLLSVVLFLVKRSAGYSAACLATALSLKPQTVVFVPVIGLAILLSYRLKDLLIVLYAFCFTAFATFYPFFPANPIRGIIIVNSGSTSLFNCTTCFALNFWGVFGNWGNDTDLFQGISYFHWGMILVAASLSVILLLRPFLKRFKEPFFYYTAALSAYAFFIFSTRMHERYLFPFFAFFLVAAILMRSKILLMLYLISSALYFLNLYIPYTYYNNQLHLELFLRNDLPIHFQLFSVLSVICFACTLAYFFKTLRLSHAS